MPPGVQNNNSFTDGMIVQSKFGWKAVIIGENCKILEGDRNYIGQCVSKEVLWESENGWKHIGWTREHNIKKILEHFND